MLTIKLTTSTSFRAIGKIGIILCIYFDLNNKTPCYTTVLLWVQKIGYYELRKPKITGNWVIIIDESIQMGCEKLLVVFGLKEDDFDFKSPLNFKDLTPLLIKSGKSWTGEFIKAELNKLKLEIGNIVYAVGDGKQYKKRIKLIVNSACL